MNRALVAIGVTLLALGVLLGTILMASRAGDARDDVPIVGEVQGRRDQTSLVWPVAAGIALAAGGACIGIGMNRWRSV